ncbi:hypothetical protein KI387_015708, partial [Taxus chinensis]
APRIDLEDDEDVTSVVVFNKEGCLIEIDDDLDNANLDEGEAPKVCLIGGTTGALSFGDEDDDPYKRDDTFLI